MSTNVSDLAFDEGEGTLGVYLIDDPNNSSPLEATQIAFQDNGVMVLTTGQMHFVPYTNVSEIKQSV
jgi:hypothetical protein